MNVDDVKELDAIEGDALEAIFRRQEELMIKYLDIDDAFKPLLARLDVHARSVADVKVWPVNLDDYVAQVLLKETAWRVTEELTESTQAFHDHADTPQHAREELADALHFLVELAILVGIRPRDITHVEDGDMLRTLMIEAMSIPKGTLSTDAYGVIQELGNAMNCLKNKPWKKSQILTDRPRFRDHVIRSFHHIGRYAWTLGMDGDDVLSFYFKKSLVNKFRQRSGY